jgi:hypothetical protein
MSESNIENFDDLLRAARTQPQPQRLLLVFVGAELPEGSNAMQRARYEAGAGGALVPLMCVDKTPEDLTTFAALREESRAAGPEWALVFVAALAGTSGRAPTSADAELPLAQMVDAIKAGRHGAYLPFDRLGQPVRLE